MPSSGLRNIGSRQNSGHVTSKKKGVGGGSSPPGFHVSFTHASTSWHTYASNTIIPFGNAHTGSIREFDSEKRFGSRVSSSGTSAYSYHIPYEGIWTFSMHIYTGWSDTSNDFTFRIDDSQMTGPHGAAIHGQTERTATDHIQHYTVTLPMLINQRVAIYTYAAQSDIHANNNYFAGMMHVA